MAEKKNGAAKANGEKRPGATPAINGRAYPIHDHTYDVVVVGAGGAGLRATLGCAEAGLKTACVTKVFPTRSHTVAAQGGVAAALGNMGPDDWRWHMYDTVKGADWLGDQDAIEYLCRNAPAAVYEMEHYGVPFSRTEDGKIYQRPFGGMTTEYGEGPPAQRTCAAADRTGHAMLHTLYGQSLRHSAEFFIEYFALDLLMDQDGVCRGILALSLDDGIHPSASAPRRRSWRRAATGARTSRAPRPTPAPATATPWCCAPDCRCRTWSSCSSTRPASTAPACSSPKARAARAAISPTAQGERFMERYAPHAKDLASRDVVSRSMTIEIREGRGHRHRQATTSTCTSTISIRRSWPSACRASPRAPRCSPASTCAASRSRCCRPCITTWAASRRTSTARC